MATNGSKLSVKSQKNNPQVSAYYSNIALITRAAQRIQFKINLSNSSQNIEFKPLILPLRAYLSLHHLIIRYVAPTETLMGSQTVFLLVNLKLWNLLSSFVCCLFLVVIQN